MTKQSANNCSQLIHRPILLACASDVPVFRRSFQHVNANMFAVSMSHFIQGCQVHPCINGIDSPIVGGWICFARSCWWSLENMFTCQNVGMGQSYWPQTNNYIVWILNMTRSVFQIASPNHWLPSQYAARSKGCQTVYQKVELSRVAISVLLGFPSFLQFYKSNSYPLVMTNMAIENGHKKHDLPI